MLLPPPPIDYVWDLSHLKVSAHRESGTDVCHTLTQMLNMLSWGLADRFYGRILVKD